MIKLLTSDVDGTLLEANSNSVSGKIMQKLRDIKNSNITLALASGRSYKSLLKLFEEICKDTYFICLDGSVIVHNNSVVYTRPLSVSDVLTVIRDEIYKNCDIMLCCPTCSYVLKASEDFAKEVTGIHTDSVKYVSAIYEITEPICKIAIHSNNTTPMPSRIMPKSLRVCYNSSGWCEYVSAIADKGLALSDLQMRLYLSKFDTASMGDGENDINMMKKAKYSICVNSKNEALKNVCVYHTDNVSTMLYTILSGNLK